MDEIWLIIGHSEDGYGGPGVSEPLGSALKPISRRQSSGWLN